MFLFYLVAGEDKNQGCSGSSESPGEEGPQQSLDHRAVPLQHGARPNPADTQFDQKWSVSLEM